MTDNAPKITSPRGTSPLRDSTDSTDSTRTSSPKESSLERKGKKETETQPRLPNQTQFSENFRRVPYVGYGRRNTKWQRFKNFFNLAKKFRTLRVRRAEVADLKKNFLLTKNVRMTPEVQRLKNMFRTRVKLYAGKVADLNQTPRTKYDAKVRLTAGILNYYSADARPLSPQNRATVFSSLREMDDCVGRTNERDLKAFEKDFLPEKEDGNQ